MDENMMREALLLAQEAAAEGEVPVGCVITLDDRIVGRGRNRRETNRTALAHAEIEAIAEACRTLGGWRLWQCTLYARGTDEIIGSKRRASRTDAGEKRMVLYAISDHV